jgi:hypothetical protein
MSTGNSMFNHGPSGVDWTSYQGFELVTADRIRLGFVSEIVADDYTGEPVLHILQPTDRSRMIRVPARYIGVITSRRLMLDVTEQNLGKLNLEVITDSFPR